MNIFYRSAHYVQHKTPSEFMIVLEEIFCIYNEAGLVICEIRSDNEFKATIKAIKSSNKCIKKNYWALVNPQQHAPLAERNIRTIKEKVRSLYHQMPHNQLPKKLVIGMVLVTTKQMNYFPARYGLSQHCCPMLKIGRRKMYILQHSLDVCRCGCVGGRLWLLVVNLCLCIVRRYRN